MSYRVLHLPSMEFKPAFKLLQMVECRSFKVEGRWIKGVIIDRYKHKKVIKYRIFTGRNDTFAFIEREEIDIRDAQREKFIWFWKK